MAKVYRALARRLKRAGALMERGIFFDAAAAYARILAEAPENEEARYNLAVAQAQLGKFAEAVRGFRAVIASRPDVATAHAALAAALETHRIDRFEPGIELKPIAGLRAPVDAYIAAINAVPMLHSCHRSLAEILQLDGRLAEAQAARMVAGLYAIDLPAAMLDLSATMARPGDLHGALALYRRSMADTPDKWEITEQEYLNSDLTFTEDKILTPDGFEVMMEWERPIMERSAEIVCHNQGDVLNVGFGMAIIDSAIQRRGVTSHTIIEAHPQVVRRAEEWARDKKAVTIIPSTWQNALESLKPFDGIYFDTIMPPTIPFLQHAPSILKQNGVLSHFQYNIDVRKLVAMIRDDLEFGIEYLEFNSIEDNTYYRLNNKNADDRYTAPLFLFRKT
jgi:tetratricopeptide (TPR) repeat protein